MARLDSYLFEQEYPDEDDNIIDLIMDLVLSLEVNQLTDEQNDMVVNILEELDKLDVDINSSEGMLATKATQKERSYFKKYYRSHKKRIRDKINTLYKSGRGKLRRDKIKRLEKTSLTPTGRSKVTHRK